MNGKLLKQIEDTKEEFPTLDVQEVAKTGSIICKVNGYVVSVCDIGEEGEKKLLHFLSGMVAGKRHS